MKRVYDFEFILMALLTLASSATFAQVQDFKSSVGAIPAYASGNPHTPNKIMSGTYTLSITTSTWHSIGANGTVAAGVNDDDVALNNISINWFNFYGASYSTIAVSSNGWLSLNSSAQTSPNPSNGSLSNPLDGNSNGQPNFYPFLAPLFGDEQVFGNVRYRTGSVVDTVEWDSIGPSLNNSVEFGIQVILDRSNYSVKYVYHLLKGSPSDMSAFGATVGIAGSSSIYLSADDLDGGNSTHANPLHAVSTVPADGLTLIWTPDVAAGLPVEATNFHATTDGGVVTLNWQTQTEVSNAGFNVLRADPGTTSFALISSFETDSRLRGYGTSTAPRSYSFTDNSVASGASYKYKIQSVSTTGATEDVSTLNVFVDVPKSYSLYQNYPNPFNPSTTIRFDLNQASNVMLEVYNVLGQRVWEENKGLMNAGRYNESIDLSHNASGVYFYKIAAVGSNGEKFVSLKKMMLVK